MSIKKIGVKHLDWTGVILETDLPHYCKSLSMYLARFMNKDQDMAWPSLTRISNELNLSRPTVVKHLDILENHGWIIRDRGNSGKNTRYIIAFPKPIENKINDVPLTSKGDELVNEVNQGSKSHELEVVNEVNPNKPLNKPIINQEGRAPPPPNLNLEAWQEFLDYRKEIKRTLNPRSQEKLLEKFIQLSQADQRRCVDYTIENGYQGLFPERLGESDKSRKSNADKHLEALRNL